MPRINLFNTVPFVFTQCLKCCVLWLVLVQISLANLVEPIETRKDVNSFLNKFDESAARDPEYKRHISRHAKDMVDIDWLVNTSNASTHGNMRIQANAIGQLSYAYRYSNLAAFETPEILDKLKVAYNAVTKSINEHGRFTWETKANQYGYESQAHEHAWLVEPLLIGYIWIKPYLNEQEQNEIEAALFRASLWLYNNPYDQMNNRGVTWASVLMLSGKYFEQKHWVDLASKIGRPIFLSVLKASGEVGEHYHSYAGGGPDSNYSYTSIAYLLMYRLWSGDNSLDPRLEAAGRWFSGYNTLSHYPVVAGASVRRMRVRNSSMRDLLPLYEMLSTQNPFYASQAVRTLRMIEEESSPAFGSQRPHIVSPIVFARLFSSQQKAEHAIPKWQSTRNQTFSFPQVNYSLVSRENYQTGIVLSARSGFKNHGKSLYGNLPADGIPLRGMQTWAYKDEPPIVLHGKGGLNQKHSYAMSEGVKTAELNIDQNNHILAYEHLASENGDLGIQVLRQGPILSIFVFTPASTVAIYRSQADDLLNYWHMNRDYLAGHSISRNARLINFIARNAKLYFFFGKATKNDEGIFVEANRNINFFGFSDKHFTFHDFNEERGKLSFSDASGQYELNLNKLIDRKLSFSTDSIRINSLDNQKDLLLSR